MDDYIKREDALEQFDYYDLSEYLTTQIRGMLMDVPSADVAPVLHGRWLKTGAYPHRVYCSVCSRTYAQAHWEVWKDGSLARTYCPSCGAKMDKGGNDGTDD